MEELEIPIDCCCPISLEPMQDPVMLAETGQTYERACIERWLLQAQKKTDPVTGAVLSRPRPRLIPNHAVRKLVQSIQENTQLWAKQAAVLSAKDAEVDWRARELEAHQAKLEVKRQNLEVQRCELKAQMKELSARQTQMKALESDLNLRRSQLRARERELKAREAELGELADAISLQEDDLGERSAALQLQKKKMKRRFVALGWKKCQQALGVGSRATSVMVAAQAEHMKSKRSRTPTTTTTRDSTYCRQSKKRRS